ncbi:membrane protein [Streptomyces sp. MMG1533]|nr:membrane protein [Streptomyces sp. MMG1533]
MAQPLQRPSFGRAAALLGLLVLGALVGVAGTLVQSGWFPGGLLLGLAGEAGLCLGGARVTGSRAGAVAPAGGWMLSVILLTASRPEGDFMFAAGSGSYLFLLGGMAVAVICATLGRGRQPVGDGVRLGK